MFYLAVLLQLDILQLPLIMFSGLFPERRPYIVPETFLEIVDVCDYNTTYMLAQVRVPLLVRVRSVWL